MRILGSFESALGAALEGMKRGARGVAESATRIANYHFSENETDSVVDAMVDLKQSEHQVKASAKALKTIAETNNETLDIIA